MDVLEIMRNIHVFVSKYLYNLNNQVSFATSVSGAYVVLKTPGLLPPIHTESVGSASAVLAQQHRNRTAPPHQTHFLAERPARRLDRFT